MAEVGGRSKVRKGTHRKAEKAEWSTGGVSLNVFVDGLESSKVENLKIGLNYLAWSF